MCIRDRIEGEEARLEFIEGTARARTKKLRAVDGFASRRLKDIKRAATQRERRIDKATAIRGSLPFAEASEFDTDGVLDIAVERLELRRLDPFAIDAQQRIALLFRPLRDLGVISLSLIHI